MASARWPMCSASERLWEQVGHVSRRNNSSDAPDLVALLLDRALSTPLSMSPCVLLARSCPSTAALSRIGGALVSANVPRPKLK
eukprot:CAMPEP_0185210432 /NCGR_PEP_ID=MMETSP1140-20130426/65624_1 /TAXON_ID=298111 /ORGANISM="Pavlova sp., Strain CCMP459" /LENGTH=83 /DNA_ID=CAMNT_0027778239 /DNA_START=152 /DNA_END=403 /DNA_ORIENTATION=+